MVIKTLHQYLPLVLAAFILVSASVISFAATINEFDATLVEKNNPLTAVEINRQLLVLLELVPVDPKSAEKVVEQMLHRDNKFNGSPTEQYLFSSARAELAIINGNVDEAIKLLTQAHLLAKNISEIQLLQPMFSKRHLLLAQAYQSLKKYDLAYQEKERYIKIYHQYSAARRADIIAKLTQKYQVAYKNKKNELLHNENILKDSQISEQQRRKTQQQHTIILVVILAVLVIFLFIRELIFRKKLLFLAKMDVLTGIYNRSTFMNRGHRLFAHRDESEFSLFVLDIDDFKRINHEHGHVVGDKVLIQIALLGKDSMRSTDTFARFAGEEFVGLLPNTSAEEASAIAEHIKDKISSQPFKVNDIEIMVTVSIGVTSSKHVDSSFDALFSLADNAMHDAKDKGKNQVVNLINRVKS